MANYLTTDTELTSVANAIRTKGGTAANLIYPTGFVSAIENIPSGLNVEYGIIPANYEKINTSSNYYLPTKAIIKLDNAQNADNLSGAFGNEGDGIPYWIRLKQVEFEIGTGTLTKIPQKMFYNSQWFNYLPQSIMNNITEIGTYAFYYTGIYNELNSYDLVLPNIVTIGSNAFRYNNKITSITLGTYGNNNLNLIDIGAFRNLNNCDVINILEKPSTIGSNCFTAGKSTAVMNVVWSEGEVSGAPWGFTGTINYNYVPA